MGENMGSPSATFGIISITFEFIVIFLLFLTVNLCQNWFFFFLGGGLKWSWGYDCFLFTTIFVNKLIKIILKQNKTKRFWNSIQTVWGQILDKPPQTAVCKWSRSSSRSLRPGSVELRSQTETKTDSNRSG